MTCAVRRTCHDIGERDSRGPTHIPSRPVEDWKDEEAYVLLGPPGSGKTTIFKHLAERQGGRCVTARDFLTFDDRAEWHDTTLFIDGLDETRAGTDRRAYSIGQYPCQTRANGASAFSPVVSRGRLVRSERQGSSQKGVAQRSRQGAPPRSPVRPRHPPISCTLCSESKIRRILSRRPKGRASIELLVNPQSLKMLAVAVGAARCLA